MTTTPYQTHADQHAADEAERARWHAAAARATTARIERMAAAAGLTIAELDPATRMAFADIARNTAGNTLDVLCRLLSTRPASDNPGHHAAA